MKTTLLLLCLCGIIGANAQVTHNLDWSMASGTNLDLTIDEGDTVIWTWADALPHTVENEVGNSVETFNSGVLTGMGETFSHTFTVVGTNAYFCGVHGAGMMAGTITVEEVLGVGEESIREIELYPNPVSSLLHLQLPKNLADGEMAIFDLLGKQVQTQTFSETSALELNVSNLNSGLYFIKVISGGSEYVQRFVKN